MLGTLEEKNLDLTYGENCQFLIIRDHSLGQELSTHLCLAHSAAQKCIDLVEHGFSDWQNGPHPSLSKGGNRPTGEV